MAVSVLYQLGFFELMHFLQKKRVTILMYHRFSAKTEPFKLSQKTFDRQLHYLSRKYNIISFKEYVQVLNGVQPNLPPNPLIITIDDGYQDNYEYAFPLLKKYNVPATIFLASDFISRKAWLWSNRLGYILKHTANLHFSFPVGGEELHFNVGSFSGWHQAQLALFNYCRTLPNTRKNEVLNELAKYLKVDVPEEVTDAFSPLTWVQIREMQHFQIEYGSHTCSHPIMSQLSGKELDRELNVSKKNIETNTGSKVNVFCYPNGQPGDISKRVVDAVQRSGYQAAVTTTFGYNPLQDGCSYLLKRISLGGDNQAFIARNLTQCVL